MASLSNEEQQRLASSLTRLIDSGKFVNLSNFHGYPPNVCPDLRQHVCCPHNGPTFLPWHRLFMVQMEEELGEALPYWDWTEDAELPRFWSEIEAPIKEGLEAWVEVNVECDRPPSRFVRRLPNVKIDTEVLKKRSREAFLETNYYRFYIAINTPHNSIHKRIGCEMDNTATAAYDPMFFLHHSYVDFQWAFWQELQRLRGRSVMPLETDMYGPYDIQELGKPLRPFNVREYNHQDRTFR